MRKIQTSSAVVKSTMADKNSKLQGSSKLQAPSSKREMVRDFDLRAHSDGRQNGILRYGRLKICATVALLLLLMVVRGKAQLTFSTLAGYPGGGAVDGYQTMARFVNPVGVATDTAGNIYVADSGNHVIRKITPSGTVTTLAGLAGVSGTADGTNSTARFNQPGGLAVDSSGTVYVADTGNNTIRKITPVGVVTTFAGAAGIAGSLDQLGTNAWFNSPQSVVLSSSGYLFVADYGNHTIRKITAGGSVSTFAGAAGNPGSNDAGGTSARFNQPSGITIDSNDNLYVADSANGTIRRVSPSATVTTFAGSAGNFGTNDGIGSNARFYLPVAVACDASGNVYVAEYFNSTIRMITPGASVSTFAGMPGVYGYADGTNAAARFRGPEGIAVSATGEIYIADTGNSTIRKALVVGPDVLVSTFVGSASTGAADEHGNNARFYWPGGLAFSGASVVYVADTENSVIRKLTAAGLASTFAGSAGNFGSNDGGTNVARFYGPQGIVADASGNLFVADSANASIRKIAVDGTVSTIAGLAGTTGSLDGTNSGALFSNPEALAIDAGGTIYVADTWNHTIRKVTTSGVVSTIAGYPEVYGAADGTNSGARFYWPAGIVVDAATNLYVSDSMNHTIRKIAPIGTNWVVTTLAGYAGIWGTADGSNNVARFFRPQRLALDGSGNLYVADTGNATIRKVSAAGTNWAVTTAAGLALASGSTNGTGSAARFNSPVGVAVSSGGSVMVTDSGNNTIRLSGITVNGAPAIINQPLSQRVNPTNNVTFNVAATGSGTLSYQWRFNGTNIAGATASSFTRTNAQVADTGNYSVLITNSVGQVVSIDAALVVNIPVFIIQQPQSQVARIGQPATFSVLAGGTAPIAYQWRFQGGDIPGATASSYTIPAIGVSNAGPYSVMLNNIAGTQASVDAILSIVSLVAFGDDSFGQAEAPLMATNTIAVVAGGWHSLALRADGHIIAWGDDFSGQCNVPGSLTDALAIAAGGYHSMAIRANGTVVAWGANDYGQTNVPAGLSNVLAIACGTWHSLALQKDGTVVAWGDNTHRQNSPPAGLTGVVAIAAGGNHSLALKSDGTVIAWGDNLAQGGGYGGQSDVPAGLTHVTRIAAGDFHSLAIRSDGSIVTWGDNKQGQCTVPEGLTNVVAISGGGLHSLALNADGTVSAWGGDAAGQCDLAAGLADVVGISGGEAHTLVLVRSGVPDARLLNPSWSGGAFSAIVQTLNRNHYALEYSPSLAPQVWTAVATNSGNGGLQVLSDSAASGQPRFYRMRQW